MIENADVALIGGSETTASTMSNVFFYLLTNPDVFRRLRAELDEAFPPGEGDPFDFTRLAELPYLNAVMYVVVFSSSSTEKLNTLLIQILF